MKVIQKIEPKFPERQVRKKVAAYCRASLETDRLLHSLSAQVSFYSSFIQKNPEWEYVGVYSDSGLSGTTDNRRGFQELLQDCEDGKVDLVLTKSISRFARNTVDLLATVRHLKKLGIEVRFEKENISSLSDDGELMLSLLASFAQEESYSISENVKWGIRKKFKNGRGHSFIIYGYHWDGKEFHIVPEEAEVIRLIFDNYLNGFSAEQTQKQLEEMGVRSRAGKPIANTSIRAILRQDRYTGNTLLQKTHVESHITHRSVANRGELPMYYVENSHPAIISQDMFDKVQDEIKRRREFGGRGNMGKNVTAFTSMVACDKCGSNYGRKKIKQRVWAEVRYLWKCQTKDRKGIAACHAKDIPEIILEEVSAKVLCIETFDEELFQSRIEKIVAVGQDMLLFRFREGTEVMKKWKSTAKKDCWTPERKAQMSEIMMGNRRQIGEKESNNDTSNNQ